MKAAKTFFSVVLVVVLMCCSVGRAAQDVLNAGSAVGKIDSTSTSGLDTTEPTLFEPSAEWKQIQRGQHVPGVSMPL